jgi:hypothetical protein
MSAIYQSVPRVLVWLSKEDASTAMSHLERIAQRIDYFSNVCIIGRLENDVCRLRVGRVGREEEEKIGEGVGERKGPKKTALSFVKGCRNIQLCLLLMYFLFDAQRLHNH